MRIVCMPLFFFFQAEDGIRDYKVTGVQTCALPICSRCLATRGCCFFHFDSPASASFLSLPRLTSISGYFSARARDFDGCTRGGSPRSEERRVGEECRSRWSPDHLKKKKVKSLVTRR